MAIAFDNGHRADTRPQHRSAVIPNPTARPTTTAPMRRWDYRYLGERRFPGTLSALEIEHFFTLDARELAQVRDRRGALNRMALGLQVGFLKMTGTTLNSVELIAPAILDHLGRQLDCMPPQIASIRAFYQRRRRTLFEHHATALRLLGRSDLTPHAERGLMAYLRQEAAVSFDHVTLMANARIWLVEHHYLVGPSLWHIVCRKIAIVPGYDYSATLRTRQTEWQVWDAAALDVYLRNPREAVHGVQMYFKGLPEESDRADVIAYLRTLQ